MRNVVDEDRARAALSAVAADLRSSEARLVSQHHAERFLRHDVESAILTVDVQRDHPFDRAVLMFQREFAERLVARPGTKDYSRLTVNAAHRAAGEILERVPRSAFHPQPRVDSAVVRLVRRPPAYHVMDEDTFHAVVDACFAHRRKTVGNSLAIEWKRFAQDRTSWREILPALPFQARRPESVAPEEFATLANAVSGAKG